MSTILMASSSLLPVTEAGHKPKKQKHKQRDQDTHQKSKKVPTRRSKLPPLLQQPATESPSTIIDDVSVMTYEQDNGSVMQGGSIWEQESQLSSLDNQSAGIYSSQEALIVLKDRYKMAKFRAAELAISSTSSSSSSSSSSSVHMLMQTRLHAQVASKLYSAVSCILYATLGCMQASDLENFIRKKCIQLPAQMFDIREWYAVLKVARECRETGGNEMAEREVEKGRRRLHHSYEHTLNQVTQMNNAVKKISSGIKDDLSALKGNMDRDLRQAHAALKLLANETLSLKQQLQRSKEEAGVSINAANADAAAALAAAKAEAVKGETEQASLLQQWAEQRTRLENDLQESTTSLAAANARVSELEAEAENVRKSHAKQEEAIKNLSSALSEAAVDAANSPSRLSPDAAVSTSQVTQSAQLASPESTDELNALVSDLRRQLSDAQEASASSLSAEQQRNTELDARLRQLEMDAVNERATTTSLLKQLEESKLENSDVEKQLGVTRAEVSKLQGQLTLALSISQAPETLENNDAALASEESKVEAKADGAEQALQAAQTALHSARIKLAISEEDLKATKSRIEELTLDLEATKTRSEEQRRQHVESADAAAAAAKTEINEIRAALSASSADRDAVMSKVTSMSTELATATKQLQESQESVAAMQAKDRELTTALATSQEAEQKSALISEEATLPLNQARTEIAGLTEQLQASRRELQEELDRQAAAAAAGASVSKQNYDAAFNTSASGLEASAEVERLGAELAAVGASLQGEKNERVTLTARIKELEVSLAAATAAAATAASTPSTTAQAEPALKEGKVPEQPSPSVRELEAIADKNRIEKLLSEAKERALVEEENALLLTKRIQQLEESTALLERKVSTLEKEKADLSSLSEQSAKISNVEHKLAEADENSKAQQLQAELEQTRAELLKAKHEAHASSALLMEKELSFDGSRTTVKALQKEIATLQHKLAALTNSSSGNSSHSPASSARSVMDTPSIHSSVTTKLKGDRPREYGITLLQANVRGMISRHNLRRTIAQHTGGLVAVAGTRQGESGWYSRQGVFFYFCLDEGEYLLLCGPLTEDMYNLAIHEANTNRGFSYGRGMLDDRPASREDRSLFSRPNSRASSQQQLMEVGRNRPISQQTKLRLRKRLAIDRVGIRAARVQMEVLLGDINDRTVELSIARNALSNFQLQVKRDLEALHTDMQLETQELLESHQVEIAEWQSKVEYLQQCLMASEKTLIAEKRNHILTSTKTESWRGRLESAKEQLDKHQLRGICRMQALVRGVHGRRRLRRLVQTLKAKTSGVLVAMPNTTQGSSGWYSSPTGEIFYFIHDEEDNWILACGPMTMDEFEHEVEKTGPRASYTQPAILSRCAFDLAPQHAYVKSSLSSGSWRWRGGISESAELYIQGKTARLYVALQLDDAISLARAASAASMSRGGGVRGGGGSRRMSRGSLGAGSTDSFDGGDGLSPSRRTPLTSFHSGSEDFQE